MEWVYQTVFSAIVYFFPLLTLAPTLLDISILQEKTEQYIQFYLPEKKLPTCAAIPSFLFKVFSYSPAIIWPCAVFVIWSQSLSHLVDKKKKNQPVLLKPLSPHFCTRKFTEWFSNDSSYCDYAFAGQILGFSAHQSQIKRTGTEFGGSRKVALRRLE